MSRAKVEPGWQYLGGTSRRYRNLATGETISREKYERLFGNLKKKGAKSFKDASLRNPLEERLSRPARNRKGRTRRYGVDAFRGLRPLADRQGRDVEIPFSVYVDENGHTNGEEEVYRNVYNTAIDNIRRNSYINAIQIKLAYNTGFRDGFITVMPLTRVDSVLDYDEVIEKLKMSSLGVQYTSMIIYVHFDPSRLFKSKNKKKKVKIRKKK